MWTEFCKDADAGDEGHVPVLKCMVQNAKDLSGSCQAEVSTSLYSILCKCKLHVVEYKKNASLSEP